jgi:malonyl-ACP decarboxylase
MERETVITGIGIVSSIGKNISEFSAALKEGKSGIGFSGQVFKSGVKIGAIIRDFDFTAVLQQYEDVGRTTAQRAKSAARRSPFPVQCATIAALEAWIGSGFGKISIPPERIGIVVAGSNLTSGFQYSMYKKLGEDLEYTPAGYAIQYADTDHVGTLSEIFGIQGEGFTVGGASASGNVGIVKAHQLVRFGIVDACIVVGSLADLSPMEIQAFTNTGGMGGKVFADEPTKACRPFDVHHEGFIYGQGSGCIIIESHECARRRNVPILAYLSGGAVVLDGNRMSNPNEDGEVRAMEEALRQAGMSYEEIDYINAHATSTPLGDETEIKAIKRVFKERLPHVWINSTKSMTGHCLYSAGVVEAIAAIIQMKEGFVHPNLNLERPIDSECKFSGPVWIPSEIRTAMSNSFGFGGINTSIILKKGE